MMVIGVDYHQSFQAIAFLVEETGECGEQELNHSDGRLNYYSFATMRVFGAFETFTHSRENNIK